MQLKTADHLLTGGVSLVLLIITCWFFRSTTRKVCRSSALPPLKGSASLLYNARMITTIKGAAGLLYVNNLCKELESEIAEVAPLDKGSGVIYELQLPFQGQFFVCSDYKAAHTILEGDSVKGIPETEKSRVVQQFDLYPGHPNMFR
jgi:hypothetical protein